MPSTSLKAHIALLSVNLIYAINFLVAKEIMPAYIQPLGFIVIRVGIATCLYWLTALCWRYIQKRRQPNIAIVEDAEANIFPTVSGSLSSTSASSGEVHLPSTVPFTPNLLSSNKYGLPEGVTRKEAITFALCGLFGVALNQMFFFKGLSLTSPIHGALIMITTPILVLILSIALFRSETFTPRKVAGAIIGLLGAAMIILQGATQVSSRISALGDFYIFLNASSYGLYLVLVKPLMAKYHFIDVTKWTFFLGFWVVLPFGWQELMQINWASFTPFVWYCLVYVVFMVTFMAYLLNSYALRSVDASVASAYIYTQPLLTTLLAVSLGKDAPNMYTLLAGMLIFWGVYWVTRVPKNKVSTNSAS